MKSFGPYAGVVDQIHDGDTVDCRLDLGFDLTVYARVRISGIDAPELATDAGKQALAYAKTLLKPGDPVLVVSHDWDKYGGRIDGSIGYGDTGHSDFADAMLQAGQAQPYTGGRR